MSSADDATRVTTTTATVVTPTEADPHDGVVPEPGRGAANVLWFAVIVTLCLGVLALIGAIVMLAFVPAEPKGSADAATLVAVLGSVLTALVGFYASRQRR